MEDECLTFTELAESTKKIDKDMAAYTAVWSTKGCRVTKDGHRHELRLHFQVRFGPEVSYDLHVYALLLHDYNQIV